MKKVLLTTSVLFFAMLSIFAVKSYTSATVVNDAMVNITNPHGMIFYKAIYDQLSIKQGEDKAALILKNNTGIVIDYQLDYFSYYMDLIPDSGWLDPGESKEITLHVDDLCPTGYDSLAAYLYVDFAGGNGRLRTDLELDVRPGVLDLKYDTGSFTSSWNSGSAPESTKILYRYKSIGSEEWEEWKEVEDTGSMLGDAGEYEYMAKVGNTESEVVCVTVEPPAEAETADDQDSGGDDNNTASGGGKGTDTVLQNSDGTSPKQQRHNND